MDRQPFQKLAMNSIILCYLLSYNEGEHFMDSIHKVPGTLTLISPNLRHIYEVHYKRYTISTLLLFTQTMPLKERIVIKILRGYKDNRYHLGKLYERQKCQVEALQWNRKFAPGVYIGL